MYVLNVFCWIYLYQPIIFNLEVSSKLLIGIAKNIIYIYYSYLLIIILVISIMIFAYIFCKNNLIKNKKLK